jgi:hypothetical protein
VLSGALAAAAPAPDQANRKRYRHAKLDQRSVAASTSC